MTLLSMGLEATGMGLLCHCAQGGVPRLVSWLVFEKNSVNLAN